jgi:hypothetical protein
LGCSPFRKNPEEDLSVRDDITEWSRNLQNKTFYKFAISGEKTGGMKDDRIGIQVSQRIVVFGRRRKGRRIRPFTIFLLHKDQ